MNRQYYLDLAARGLRMPVGTDLVLHEQPDHEAIQLDGARLGKVVEMTARRYQTPLAVPLMDLTVEKSAMLSLLGISAADALTWHFAGCPDDAAVNKVHDGLARLPSPRLRATVEAVRYIATKTDLIPVGMAIGPFSMMTKLLAEPITPVYMAASGVTADDDEEVRMVERTLDLAIAVILRSLDLQIEAGAKAIFIAEPAASTAFLSPMQIQAGSDIYDRYVIQYNRRIKQRLEQHGIDLIFHCCGELTDYMVGRFNSLDPAILSLGSSRKLWEDARLVSRNTVLYGNMPTKRFYSDELISRDQVRDLARDLLGRMKQVNHPFILGSECDVLSVKGCEHKIKDKVDAFVKC